MSYAPLNSLNPSFLFLVILSTLSTFISSSFLISPSSQFTTLIPLYPMPYPLYYVSRFPLVLFPCYIPLSSDTIIYSLYFISHFLYTTSLPLSHVIPSCFPLSFPFSPHSSFLSIYNHPTGNRYPVIFSPLFPIIIAFYVVIPSSIFLIILLSHVNLSSLFSIVLPSYPTSLPILYPL